MTRLYRKEGEAPRGVTLMGAVPRDRAIVRLGSDCPVIRSKLAGPVPLKFPEIQWQKRQVFLSERKCDSLK